jgi:ligand-binding SRPBCC domain-containing protein
MEKMGLDALANLEYPDHFTRQVEGWSKNHRYLDKTGEELRTAIVGEIAGPEWGTIVRAQGNYFAREGDDVRSRLPAFLLAVHHTPQFKPIDDKAKIKDTLAITIPTCSSTRLYNTVANQNIVAGQVTSANTDEDMRNGRVSFSFFYRRPFLS